MLEEREDVQKVLKLSLEIEAGWQVIGANSAREAFTLLEQSQFDGIILNFVSKDPSNVIKRLKINPFTTTIPIIAIAKTDRLGECAYLAELGVKVVIPQMLNPILLADRIAKKLNWQVSNNTKN